MVDFLLIKEGLSMKKIAMVFGVALISSVNNGFYGSQLIQKEYDQEEYSQPRFLDADRPSDEYIYMAVDEYQENSQDNQAPADNQVTVDNQTDVAEYDQHVCDEVKPPKISAAEALIKEMLGYMLVQYLAFKEMTHAYCNDIKAALQKWFAVLMRV
jgi:K+-transporting ATPase c subunit